MLFSITVVSCGSGSGKPAVDLPGSEANPKALRLVFEDDFGGPMGAARLAGKAALPANNWRVETGYDDNGWGNDEWQNYTASTDNLFVENGALVISAQCSTGDSCSDAGVNKRTGTITSARINSKNKLNVHYGSVSARIKMPSGIGTWPAFWMLGADIDKLRWPDAGEIDIVEMHYKFSDTKTTHFTTHWSAPNYAVGENPTCSGLTPGVNPGEQQHCFTASKTFDTPLTDDFHVFEVVWDENSITGKIDGITYYTLAIDSATMEEFQKDYFMILNVAVGGTLGGAPGASIDWTDPNQTSMLVDWVRVYERAQPDSATLIDESGNNLPYNRIINSAEFGAAFVDSDLESQAVTPLVGDQVLELDYSTSLSSAGGATQGYSAAFFSFNRIDLSNFNNIIFSMDVSQFENFDDVAVEFEDANSGKASVRTSSLTPIATVGNWNTYKIPFSDYVGVAMDDIKFLSFISPNDVNDNLIAGKLYLDDIRFSQEACTAAGVITFDSANYNPDTRVGAVNIDDICAAGSLASVEVDNGSEQITLGVKLDSAGKGQVTFGLVNGRSVCPVDDQKSILPLSGALTATYTKVLFEDAATNTFVVTAQAGVDGSAPGTMLVGDELFLYSTDQALTFLPDNDFAYSVFGSESLLNGAASDATFNPSFGVTSGTGYGGGIHVAQIIWLGGEAFPGFAGFADGKQSLNFKIKDLPGNTVKIEVGVAGAGVDALTISDVTSSAFSTPIGSTGWYQIVIPFTEFPASSTADFLAITGGDNGTSVFTFLITDVAVQESLANVPASCETLLPPVGSSSSSSSGGSSSGGGATGGGATGGSVPDVTIYEADASTADLSPGYDPFGSVTGIASVADTTYTQALELTVANGYGPSLAQLGLTGLSFTGFDEFLFKVKGLTADNTIRVTAEATGGGSINIDLTSAPSGVTATDLGDGWTQVVIALTAFGDVSSASQVVFQTLDNAYSVGDTFLLTDIGFNNATGGSSSGGSSGGGQLAVNGDIEAGDLSSWTLNQNGGAITADNTQNSGSTWSVHVVAGPGNNPSLSLAGLAVGTVVPGDTIDVSFDMCGSAASGGVIFPALLSEFGGGTGADRVNLDTIAAPPSVWTRFNYSQAAGSNVTGGVSLQLDVVCGADAICAADVFFDNVSVTIGGGVAPGSASGASCAAPVVPPVGVVLPVDFEGGPFVFTDFDGGQASVEANSQSGGINVSANVGKMLKFVGQVWGGSTFDLGGTLTVPANSVFTMNVWSSRAVPVLFKLEGGPAAEVAATHSGGSVWEELTFDFTGIVTGDHTGITLIFDNGTNGAAATDPGNWTFYFDDINLGAAPPPPSAGELTIFADTVATGWSPWQEGAATWAVVADDAAHGDVIEFSTAGMTVVGVSNRVVSGGSGVTHDASSIAATGTVEFDLKMTAAPATTIWKLKFEGTGGVEVDLTCIPVLNTWVHCSFPLSGLGDLSALNNVMIFPNWADNAGAVYRVDNLMLVAGGGGGPGPASGELTTNGGFETGDFTGTVQFANSGTQTISAVNPKTGTFSANLFVANTVSDTVLKFGNLSPGGFTPGQTVTVSFDMRGSLNPGGVGFAEFFSELSGGGTSKADILFGGGPIFPNADPAVWTHFSTTVTTGPDTSGGVTLQLKVASGGSTNAELFFDNVSVSVP